MTLLKRSDKYLAEFRAGTDDEPVDFTGCTLRFLWRRADRSGSLEVVDVQDRADDTTGVVRTNDWHRLADGDWDVELEATDGEGNIATYPTPQDDGVPLYLRVTIAPDLG